MLDWHYKRLTGIDSIYYIGRKYDTTSVIYYENVCISKKSKKSDVKELQMVDK